MQGIRPTARPNISLQSAMVHIIYRPWQCHDSDHDRKFTAKAKGCFYIGVGAGPVLAGPLFAQVSCTRHAIDAQTCAWLHCCTNCAAFALTWAVLVSSRPVNPHQPGQGRIQGGAGGGGGGGVLGVHGPPPSPRSSNIGYKYPKGGWPHPTIYCRGAGRPSRF